MSREIFHHPRKCVKLLFRILYLVPKDNNDLGQNEDNSGPKFSPGK